jgi:ribose transport system permease protein
VSEPKGPDSPASQRAPAPPGPTSDEGATREGSAVKGAGRRAGQQTLWRRLVTASATWTFLVLVIEMAYFTAASPGKFLTLNDLSLISQGAAPFLVMAIGQTFVIITAGIDLSVGFVLVLSGVVAGEFYLSHGAANASAGIVWLGALIGLAVGMGWGLLQGFMVAKLKIPALIATLAGLGGAEGISYLITGGSDVRVVPNKLISSIGTGYIFGIQWLIVISFAATLVFGLVLAYTRFGRYTYAIGSNPEAAARAGIRVDRHLIKVYGLSGLMAGLAGILNLAYFGTTTISGHPLDNLTVITAVVLGGASLFGGRGSMLGTLIGVYIPAMLATGLIIVGVNQYWQYVLTGAVLAAAVYLDQFRRRLRERL